MSEILSEQTVEHMAGLARLKLSEDQLTVYREQLAGVLDHIGTLSELELDDVEPLAHPLPITNHLDEDVIGSSLPADQFLRLAPATEGAYLAVPKVIGEGEA